MVALTVEFRHRVDEIDGTPATKEALLMPVTVVLRAALVD